MSTREEKAGRRGREEKGGEGRRGRGEERGREVKNMQE